MAPYVAKHPSVEFPSSPNPQGKIVPKNVSKSATCTLHQQINITNIKYYARCLENMFFEWEVAVHQKVTTMDSIVHRVSFSEVL